jgi:hypothetical protein
MQEYQGDVQLSISFFDSQLPVFDFQLPQRSPVFDSQLPEEQKSGYWEKNTRYQHVDGYISFRYCYRVAD